ncbi:MAG: SusE domain-containing protein [Paludibacter sp.]
MKRHIKDYTILVLLFSLISFFSCENDWDQLVVQPDIKPNNVTVDNTSPFVCTMENGTDVAFTFSWSEASFGKDIPVSYVLQFDKVGNNFKAPISLVAGNNITEKGVLSSDLNSLMHALGQPIDVSTPLEVRVLSIPMVVGSASPELETMLSDSKATIYVSSYAMPPVHLLGAMFGAWGVDPHAWDAANYTYVMFRDNPLGLDKYVARFEGFSPVTYAGQVVVLKDADLGQWNQIGKGGEGQLKPTSKGGSNINMPATGYYTFTVDMINMSYSITPYDANNAKNYEGLELTRSGDSPITLSQAYNNPHIWQADNVELSAADKVRFSTTGPISTSWGSDAFPWGTGNTSGVDINVTRTGNYFVKFNDLTGHYIFYKKNKK